MGILLTALSVIAAFLTGNPQLKPRTGDELSGLRRRGEEGLTMLEQLLALGAILLISAGVIYGGSVVYNQANLAKAQNEVSMLIASALAYRESPSRSNFAGISFTALKNSGYALPYTTASGSNAFGQGTTIAPMTAGSVAGAECRITYKVGDSGRCNSLKERYQEGQGNIKSVWCNPNDDLEVNLGATSTGPGPFPPGPPGPPPGPPPL